MCIVLSLPKEFSSLRDLVRVAAVVETLIYRSATREVVISFDCLVQNRAAREVDLWLTHADNVEGRLGTEDWFAQSSPVEDERTALIRKVYGECWDFDRKTGRFGYRDPIEAFSESAGCRPYSIVAYPLSFRSKERNYGWARDVYSDFLDLDAEAFLAPNRGESAPVYRLRNYPLLPNGPLPNGELLPFSTFRIGPILPSVDGIATMFRLTVVISDGAYHRLVQPQDGAPFHIYSSDRLCEAIEDFQIPRFRRDRRYETYRKFYETEIRSSVIAPQRYQILIQQPSTENSAQKCLSVRPTSSRISQRIIDDPAIRNRALWFDAWSSNFSMVLNYLDQEPHEEAFRIVDTARLSLIGNV